MDNILIESTCLVAILADLSSTATIYSLVYVGQDLTYDPIQDSSLYLIKTIKSAKRSVVQRN